MIASKHVLVFDIQIKSRCVKRSKYLCFEMFTISTSEYESSKLPDFYHKLFRAVENDPKFTRLDYLQEYSQKLKARNEISEEVYKRTRPIDGRLARAHGLHKLQKKKKKEIVHLLKFRPIKDAGKI